MSGNIIESEWMTMAIDKQRRQKNFKYCGRFFTPDYRVWKRQVSCAREICRAKRKKDSQEKWVAANPDYFKGRYENTKEWRKQHPDYQKQWRAGKRREIQDETPPSASVKSLDHSGNTLPMRVLRDRQGDARYKTRSPSLTVLIS